MPSLDNRISSISDEAFRLERLCSGFAEAHDWINTDREQLLFPGGSILQAPVAGPIRMNEQEETAAVEELERLGRGLGGANLCVGKLVAGHGTIGVGSVPPHLLVDTPNSTPKSAG